MKNIIKIIAIAMIASVFMQCSKCKGKDPILCENGYENQNEICVCPSGKFQTPKGNYGDYDSCRVLKPNEYYTITSGCPCEDTVFFKISQLPDGSYQATTNKFKFGTAGGTTPLQYFKLPDGDSLVSAILAWEPCFIDSKPYQPQFRGKFVDPNTIKGEVLYYNSDENEVKDTCFITFHR